MIVMISHPVNCCMTSVTLFNDNLVNCKLLNCLGMIFYRKKGQNCIFLRQKILLSNSFEISLKKQCISFYTYSISGRICAILATFLMKTEQKFDLLTYWTKAHKNYRSISNGPLSRTQLTNLRLRVHQFQALFIYNSHL